MRIEYSDDSSAARIYGDHSPWPIVIKSEVIDLFNGDFEELFYEYHRLYRMNFLPYAGGENHPVSIKAWNYALENRERGEKYWWYGSKGPSGNYDVVWGFYYIDGGHAVFPDIDEMVKI